MKLYSQRITKLNFLKAQNYYLVVGGLNMIFFAEKIKKILNKKVTVILSKSNAKEKFSLETASSNFVSLYSNIDVDREAPGLTYKPLDIPEESKLNLFTYVDDRNGKAALLCSAAKRLGIPSFMVRNSDLVPDKKSSFVYFLCISDY